MNTQAKPSSSRRPRELRQHRRLHRDVQRTGRLVGDQQVRPQRQGPGQRDSLPLAAGQLVRPPLGVPTGQRDAVQQLGDPSSQRPARGRPGAPAAARPRCRRHSAAGRGCRPGPAARHRSDAAAGAARNGSPSPGPARPPRSDRRLAAAAREPPGRASTCPSLTHRRHPSTCPGATSMVSSCRARYARPPEPTGIVHVACPEGQHGRRRGRGPRRCRGRLRLDQPAAEAPRPAGLGCSR